jgi:hypothetical protein
LLAAERPALTVHCTRAGFAGSAAPPDPAAAGDTRGAFQGALAKARLSPRFTYGWRGGMAFDIPPYAVPPNVMDTFADAVDQLDAAWQPNAPAAAGEVHVTLDGRPVALDPDGRFTLPPSGRGGLLVATDGAGGATGVRLR